MDRLNTIVCLLIDCRPRALRVYYLSSTDRLHEKCVFLKLISNGWIFHVKLCTDEQISYGNPNPYNVFLRLYAKTWKLDPDLSAYRDVQCCSVDRVFSSLFRHVLIVSISYTRVYISVQFNRIYLVTYDIHWFGCTFAANNLLY